MPLKDIDREAGALPWGPAGCSQAMIRTDWSQVFGTGPFLGALSQQLKPGKGEIGLIQNCRNGSV